MRIKAKPIFSLFAFLAIALSNANATTVATLVNPSIKGSFSLDHEHHWFLIQNKDKREYLFRTEDGGVNWIASATPFHIRKLFFADASEGWGIVFEQHGEFFDKFCIHTSDSGQTWQRLGAIGHGRETPTGIAFDTSEHGWVVGEGLENDASGAAFVMETNDGGMHWTKLNWKTLPASGLYGVRLYNDQALAWSAGAGGSGIYELRPGAPPRKIFDGATMDLASYTNGAVYALSHSGVYKRNVDSNEWEETLQPSAPEFLSLAFADSQRGCAAGIEMYCTHDGGHTWTLLKLPKIGREHETVQIFWLYMIGEDIIWAVSEDAVYQMIDSSSHWTKLDFFDKNGKPLKFFHHQ